MQPGIDYSLRPELMTSKDETVPIELLLSPYKGVIMRFTEVQIKEVPEEDKATIRFAYELLQMGDFTETKLRKDKAFLDYAGLILNAMILEVAEAYDESGEDDTTELVEEPRV
jgi:hypothetical protein